MNILDGSNSYSADTPGAVQSPDAPLPEAKSTQHQVQELHRLVDGAIEDLQQVLRGLRWLERDL